MSDLRHTASEWHGGQASPLYAFSSTGTVVPGLASEIRQCLSELDAAQSERDEERSALEALLAFALAAESTSTQVEGKEVL